MTVAVIVLNVDKVEEMVHGCSYLFSEEEYGLVVELS